MDAQYIRNLQEAYNQVYQVDEELTGERKERALKKGGYLANRVATGREGQPVERRSRSGDITMRTTTKAPTKRGGGESKKVRKSDWSGWEADRGSGNKAARRESYDLYDIILSHLLDEGYADTEQAATAIMVNMSEEWRESIVENVSSGRAKVRNVKQRVSSAEIISNTQKQDKIAQHFTDHAAKKKAAGDEAHAAATKSGRSPSDAETARQRAHRAYEKQLKRG